jgi:hypothetical protein
MTNLGSSKYQAGLPDGTFACLKYLFWYIWEGPRMEILVIYLSIFYSHLIYFVVIICFPLFDRLYRPP